MSRNGTAGDEEEDYMSMVIEEPKQKETFTQCKLRKQREVSKQACQFYLTRYTSLCSPRFLAPFFYEKVKADLLA